MAQRGGREARARGCAAAGQGAGQEQSWGLEAGPARPCPCAPPSHPAVAPQTLPSHPCGATFALQARASCSTLGRSAWTASRCPWARTRWRRPRAPRCRCSWPTRTGRSGTPRSSPLRRWAVAHSGGALLMRAGGWALPAGRSGAYLPAPTPFLLTPTPRPPADCRGLRQGVCQADGRADRAVPAGALRRPALCLLGRRGGGCTRGGRRHSPARLAAGGWQLQLAAPALRRLTAKQARRRPASTVVNGPHCLSQFDATACCRAWATRTPRSGGPPARPWASSAPTWAPTCRQARQLAVSWWPLNASGGQRTRAAKQGRLKGVRASGQAASQAGASPVPPPSHLPCPQDEQHAKALPSLND